MTIIPQRPLDLTPDDEREFERVGIEEVRRLLTSSERQHLYYSHGPAFARAKEWIRWKSELERFWAKTGIIAAILAALFAFAGWLFPISPGK